MSTIVNLKYDLCFILIYFQDNGNVCCISSAFDFTRFTVNI